MFAIKFSSVNDFTGTSKTADRIYDSEPSWPELVDEFQDYLKSLGFTFNKKAKFDVTSGVSRKDIESNQNDDWM